MTNNTEEPRRELHAKGVFDENWERLKQEAKAATAHVSDEAAVQASHDRSAASLGYEPAVASAVGAEPVVEAAANAAGAAARTAKEPVAEVVPTAAVSKESAAGAIAEPVAEVVPTAAVSKESAAGAIAEPAADEVPVAAVSGESAAGAIAEPAVEAVAAAAHEPAADEAAAGGAAAQVADAVTDVTEVVADSTKSMADSTKKTPKKEPILSDGFKLIMKDIVIACGIALLISVFVRPTIVRETSMEPTVEPSDYLLMSRQAYRFGEVERGDIVIFKSELKLDETHNKLLIKRVIGLPGDTVAISGGEVYLNGVMLEEEYIAEGGTPGDVAELTVPEGEVFVMGDHRSVSVDSRALGCIKQEDIVGKAVFRLYPFGKFGKLE